jgi:hypothetical protein
MVDQSLNLTGVRRQAILPLYVATIFLSAFLLFSIQPLFTKMALPIVGGAPSVWSVAMVFFQTSLLAGYLYAHLLTRYLGLARAAMVHLIVTASAFSALPIAVANGWSVPPPAGLQPFWLLGLFTVSLGLPFFAVAANGPLLQAWFARSKQPTSKDPYFLYAASNLGSFGALLAYPVLIEPSLTLRDQSAWWATGFMALTVSIAACAYMSYRRGAGAPAEEVLDHSAQGSPSARATPTWSIRLSWLGCALVPSALLVAVTSYISTDIAAAPLMWVVPLALFLFTFVVAFREPALVSIGVLARVQVYLAAIVLVTIPFPTLWLLSLPLHLGCFFVSAYVCHTALYQRRPDAAHLTEFYLWLAIGGALGGIFSGLVAPHIFSTVLEYPLLVVLALLCRPGFFAGGAPVWLRGAFVMALLTAAASVAWYFGGQLLLDGGNAWLAVLLLAYAVVMMAEWRVPYRLATVAVAFLVVANVLSPNLEQVESIRSFFGVHKIAVSPDGRFRVLSHGTTVHGAMRLLNDDGTPATGRPEPTTYFTFEGAIGSAIKAIREVQGGRLATVNVIGLGSGSLACHATADERWTFMEIDADVVRIATSPEYFRFVSDCAPDADIVLGDARLTLDQAPTATLLIIDAFSSDAIPVHLITREAIAAYLTRLEDDGVLIVHISNRHLELTHVLARVAAEHGLATYLNFDVSPEPLEKRMRASSRVLAMARDRAALGAIAEGGPWVEVEPDMSRRPWTDDYSNILEAILDAKF